MSDATVHGRPTFREWQIERAYRRGPAEGYRMNWRWMERDLRPTLDKVAGAVRDLRDAFLRLPPNVIAALIEQKQ